MRGHLKALLLAAILLAIAPVMTVFAEAALPDCYAESYYAELAPMYRRLREAEGRKIVIVGGSNVAFGLDSGLMEELLREKGYAYEVCPFGLYAAVGSSAMLDLSENTLREGDIVILALEPTSETMSDYFGATAFWKCTENAPELLFGLGGDKKKKKDEKS